MRERIRPTRSGLFAIELTLAVGVFTLCAAICTGIFVQSEVMSQDSEALSRAVNEARNVAECFKAARGDLARTAQLSGGEILAVTDSGEIIETALADNSGAVTDSGAVLSRMYDAQWMETESPFDAAYQIFLTPKTESAGYVSALLQAVRTDGKVLLEWEIAALEAVS
ncbi:MAG: hypothetical protein IJQ81_04250 [Oscillibacter sp.]|nr:hypothetical protein [Oscillibacter sp.]